MDLFLHNCWRLFTRNKKESTDLPAAKLIAVVLFLGWT